MEHAAQLTEEPWVADLHPHLGAIILRLFAGSSGGGPAVEPDEGVELIVESFLVTEGLSRLFEVDLEVYDRGRAPALDWTTVCGCEGELVVQRKGVPLAEAMIVNGIVSRIEVRERVTGRNYRVRLVPAAWRLTQSKNSRIFQNQPLDQIVAGVLGEAQIVHEFHPAAARPTSRRYCVQYQETDWAFVTRLLEEEGYHTFFRHGPRKHQLIITDDPRQHGAIRAPETLDLVPPTRLQTGEEHVTEISGQQQVRPGVYTMRDQVFHKPWMITTTEEQAAGQGRIKVYEYIGDPKVERTADWTAPRLEALQAAHVVLDGRSSCTRLTAGSSFTLRGGDPSLPEQLLLTVVEHRGAQSTDEAKVGFEFSYANRFRCIPRAAPFQPPRVTSRPVIPGVQSAIVVGPVGEEIYTDQLGRVKVQFPWDREGRNDERSSCWVPVAQTWAGPSWGTLFTPRIGQQVIVGFIDGDPDQPIIVGQVYHLRNLPPYELPQDKTRSTIKTRSSPTAAGARAGFNELRFEDKLGAEELYLHAQRDMNTVVEHDQSTQVNHDRTVSVGGDQSITVTGNQQVTIKGRGRSPVHSTLTVTGKHQVDASDTIEQQAPTHIKLTCGGSSVLIEPGQITLTAGGGAQLVLDANALLRSAVGSRLLLDANACGQASGGARLLLDGNANLTSAGGAQVLLDASARASSVAGSQLVLDGNAVLSTPGQATVGASATATISAPTATLAGGGGSVQASGAGVTVAGGQVNLSGGMVNIAGGLVKIN